MTFCENCGAKINSINKFCPSCGKSIQQSTAEQTSIAQIEKKNPWIAAVLNFLLWGLGYIYNGKQIVNGVASIIGEFIYTGVMFASFLDSPAFSITLMIFIVPVSVWAGYDAYQEAKKINGES